MEYLSVFRLLIYDINTRNHYGFTTGSCRDTYILILALIRVKLVVCQCFLRLHIGYITFMSAFRSAVIVRCAVYSQLYAQRRMVKGGRPTATPAGVEPPEACGRGGGRLRAPIRPRAIGGSRTRAVRAGMGGGGGGRDLLWRRCPRGRRLAAVCGGTAATGEPTDTTTSRRMGEAA